MEIPLSYVVVTGAGEYVAGELADTLGGMPERLALIVPGTIAWDKCDCGQLAQTITSIVSSSSFPTPATDVPIRGCGHTMEMVNVTLSLLRCIAGPAGNDIAPTTSSLARDALVLEQDRLVVRRALMCYLRGLRDNPPRIFDFSIGPATSTGPDGSCGGIEINYSFALTNSAMCC